MKVNYVKRIEKMKKELQSKQMTIGLPTLIFIEYTDGFIVKGRRQRC